jgi:hypothetical protein
LACSHRFQRSHGGQFFDVKIIISRFAFSCRSLGLELFGISEELETVLLTPAEWFGVKDC